jgi:hypothetical protein
VFVILLTKSFPSQAENGDNNCKRSLFGSTLT